ncbi:tRNA threonylcarbamoyladenosine biosynthesis protein TsaE [Sphaerotilus hippei]|uniref:tRNA threonylcarbamoyladenosine biosynthesis protein TsaE n=1 Tax=Sphaerotilus hippei TaxID=744406 RepID=A0A318H086_9BURK|nr:tRNA (adenosine(37)-N6)-threonylcarbamoyltransferase complex ATPase subunit type 1 TsaE [Sphaerotilus hippei]PXW96209.1 tRNA threonylcarbamoyladenosine biosynthesis protein TsaE [Sphaerotilus hippei]
MILETLTLHWSDETACVATAASLAARPELRQACIELHGTLGAGKTTFVRHLLRAMGVQGRIKSPSYAIVETYDLPDCTVWHFDFYRFGDPREWEDAGFRELFAARGLKLVEWPDQAAGLLPVPDLRVHLGLRPDDGREVRLEAATPLGVALLSTLQPSITEP